MYLTTSGALSCRHKVLQIVRGAFMNMYKDYESLILSLMIKFSVTPEFIGLYVPKYVSN
jgi:hypothetical protein